MLEQLNGSSKNPNLDKMDRCDLDWDPTSDHITD